LPPYTEIVRFDAGARLEAEELRAASLSLLRRHLLRRPTDNPFERFGRQLDRALPDLLGGGLDDYHAYAFATARMAGSAFELAASYVRWLLGADGESAAHAMAQIVDVSKALSFRLARRRAFDPRPLIGSLAEEWARAMEALAEATR